MTLQRHQARDGTGTSRKGILIGIAAALAAAAAVNSYQARRAERRNPPMGRFLTIDGVRLHYIEKGEGPPVVLIHGNLVTADDFVYSGLVDVLAARHRVIAFDRPGMGYSSRPRGMLWTPAEQADLLRRACASLGVERPVVLGHSWGAMVAMALGLDHPEAVSGLVLLGGYYYPSVRMDVALAAPPAIPILGDVMCYTVSPLVGAALMPAFVKGMFAPLPVPVSFSRHFPPSMAVRPWQIRAMSRDGAMMIPAAAAMQERYRSLKVPLAILAGTEDKAADAEKQSARLHEEIPRSSLRLVPDVGHMLHYAVPEEILAAIDSVSAQAGATPKGARTGRLTPAGA